VLDQIRNQKYQGGVGGRGFPVPPSKIYERVFDKYSDEEDNITAPDGKK
jgi:hypothetical protein